MKHNLHGDIGLHPSDIKRPENARQSQSWVLQSSDVTGNRHTVRVTEKNSVIYHWTLDSHEYVSCENDYEIVHEGGDAEHGTQRVQAGVREVRHEVEYDPWKNELRMVVD